MVHGYIRQLCQQAGALDLNELAEALAMLVEWATVTAQVSHNPKTALIAKRAAKALIARPSLNAIRLSLYQDCVRKHSHI